MLSDPRTTEVNVLPMSVFSKFQNVPVQETHVKLSSYSDHNIEVVGKVCLPCKVKGENAHDLEFYIAQVDNPLVLGVVSCEKLNLVKKVHGVSVVVNRKINKTGPNQGMTKEGMYKTYADVFQGVGEMPGEYHITVKDNVPPHTCQHLKISLG